jgi:hypothetical protein
VSIGQGRLGYFAIGSDQRLRQAWYDGVDWQAWAEVDATVAPATAALDGAGFAGGSSIVLVSLDSSNAIVMRSRLKDTWDAWKRIDEDTNWSAAPSVAADLNDAEAYIVAVDNQSQIWARRTNGSKLSVWSALTVTLPPGATSILSPEVAMANDGANPVLHVIAKDQDGRLMFAKFPYVTGRFVGGSFALLPFPDATVGSPCIATWAYNRADVFVRNTSGTVFHAYSSNAGDGWAGLDASTWEVLPLTAASDPDCLGPTTGMLEFVANDSDGRVRRVGYSNSSWSTWLAI